MCHNIPCSGPPVGLHLGGHVPHGFVHGQALNGPVLSELDVTSKVFQHLSHLVQISLVAEVHFNPSTDFILEFGWGCMELINIY